MSFWKGWVTSHCDIMWHVSQSCCYPLYILHQFVFLDKVGCCFVCFALNCGNISCISETKSSHLEICNSTNSFTVCILLSCWLWERRFVRCNSLTFCVCLFMSLCSVSALAHGLLFQYVKSLCRLYGKLYLAGLWGRATCCLFILTACVITLPGPHTSTPDSGIKSLPHWWMAPRLLKHPLWTCAECWIIRSWLSIDRPQGVVAAPWNPSDYQFVAEDGAFIHWRWHVKMILWYWFHKWWLLLTAFQSECNL